MSEIKEQDRKKDQEGQAAIKRLSKPIKVRILLAQIFTILSALLSFVPYLALVWLGDIFYRRKPPANRLMQCKYIKL